MKTFLLLFLCPPLWAEGPYVVVHSTGAKECFDGSSFKASCLAPYIEYKDGVVSCSTDNECDDLAESLNEAHAHRMDKCIDTCNDGASSPSMSVPSEPKAEPYIVKDDTSAPCNSKENCEVQSIEEVK